MQVVPVIDINTKLTSNICILRPCPVNIELFHYRNSQLFFRIHLIAAQALNGRLKETDYRYGSALEHQPTSRQRH
jgi:hypothetical protein